MFGVFYLLANTIGLAAGYVKESISDSNTRDEFRKMRDEGKNPMNVYIDYHGCHRDLATNHKVYIDRDKNGDRIVRDLKTGAERNIDKPVREEKYRREKKDAVKQARANGGVVPFGQFTEKQYMNTFLAFKKRYIDTHGNLYIKKYMIWNSKTMGLNNSDRIGCFYMNVVTNRIDHVEVLNEGEVFKHEFETKPPYKSYDMLYANEEESIKYMEWFNTNILPTIDKPLRLCGKEYLSDYKKY